MKILFSILLLASSSFAQIIAPTSGLPPAGGTSGYPLTGNGAGVAPSYQANILLQKLGNIFYVDGFPSSCTVNAVNYTTQLDCAWYTAKQYAATTFVSASIVMGANYYSTCAGLAEPGVALYGISLIGQGTYNTWLVKTCSTPSNAVISSPATGGTFATFDMIGFTVIANGNAPSCGDFYAVNLAHFSNLNCTTPISGSAHFWQFGDSSNFGTKGFYGSTLSTISASGDPAPGTLANITVSLSGGVPTNTVNSGGSGYISGDATVKLVGTRGGTSDTPCTTMGTVTTTVTSGAIATAVASGFSGCSGTVYAQSFNLTNVTYGIDARGVSDSSFYNLIAQGPGIDFAFLGGNNKIYDAHPTYSPVGIYNDGNNTFVATECDTVQSYCFDLDGTFGTVITATNAFTPSTTSAGYSTYHFRSGADYVTFSSQGSLCNSSTPTGYNMILTAAGPVTAAGANMPTHSYVYGDGLNCGIGGDIPNPTVLSAMTFVNGLSTTNGPISIDSSHQLFAQGGVTLGGFGGNSSSFDSSGVGHFSQPPSTVSVTTQASGGTVSILSSVVTISGTTTINNFAGPSGWNSTNVGCLAVISTGTWATSTSGNIANVLTATNGGQYQDCWDGTKWHIK